MKGMTLFVCGPGEFQRRVARAWGLPEPLSMEERWCASVSAEQQAEQEAEQEAVDLTARLSGACERCREEDHLGLVLDGGEALCEPCVGLEEPLDG